jgi:hypothetical protein
VPWTERTLGRFDRGSVCGDGSVRSVAEVDDAEAIAVRVCEHDEVRIVGIAVPLDSFCSDGQEALRLGCLLGRTGYMEVQVQTRVVLRRRLTALQRNLGSPRRQPVGSAPPPIRRNRRYGSRSRAPRTKTLQLDNVPDAQSDHTNAQHGSSLAARIRPSRPMTSGEL